MKYRHMLLTRFGEPANAFQMVEDDLPEPGEGQVNKNKYKEKIIEI